MIDISESALEDPAHSLRTLQSELLLYNPELAGKPSAVAGSKLDASGAGRLLKRLQAECRKQKIKLFEISAVTKVGLQPLIKYLGEQVAMNKTTRCATRS
jgi:GTP-binding protein